MTPIRKREEGIRKKEEKYIVEILITQ